QSWVVSGMGLAGVVLLVWGSLGFGGGPDRPAFPPSQPGGPLLGLRAVETARFNAGKAQFLEVETPAGGLGPVFNDRSCVACHGAGGTGGSGDRLVTRFGRLANG